MGRELKRVALDFDWPLSERWEGYLNPHYKSCDKCDGSGDTRAYVLLKSAMTRIVKGAEITQIEERTSSQHYQRPDPDADGYDPKVRELVEKLSGRELNFHSSSLAPYYLADILIEAAGYDKHTWGLCTACTEGVASSVYDDYINWEPTEPPEGEGWQVWETVSEGSPVTPVFATADELIEHLCTIGTDWGRVWSREGAENFVKRSGWAPSFVATGGKVVPGYEPTENNGEELE